MAPTIVDPRNAAEVALVKALFEEYAGSLGVDLSFQRFSEEMAAFPGAYRAPGGALLLALERGAAAGAVGLRPLDAPGLCEMKRLYVRPAWRGTGLGRRLAEAVVARGRALGYRAMRLDTLPFMAAAQALYQELGFREIAPYTYNPIPGSRFLERRLDA